MFLKSNLTSNQRNFEIMICIIFLGSFNCFKPFKLKHIQ
jgi:hypothetical protein